MLEKLVESALRYKFLVLIFFGVVAFLGWRAVVTVPVDAFPDVTPTQVNIYTESPGLAAEDVEQLLTFPIESGMAGLPGVDRLLPRGGREGGNEENGHEGGKFRMHVRR